MVAHRHLRPPRAPLERRYLSPIVASAEGTQGCILDAKMGDYIGSRERAIEFLVNSYYYNYFRIFAREFLMSALSLFPTNSLGIPGR